MSMSYEERLVRGIAKLTNCVISMWHFHPEYFHPEHELYLGLFSGCHCVFGPYTVIEDEFKPNLIWEKALCKIMDDPCHWELIHMKMPASIEELEIKLAIVGA